MSAMSRPLVICHMMSSIDGRLLVDRWTLHADGGGLSGISRMYESCGQQLAADAFIIGRRSMSEFDQVQIGDASVGPAKARRPYRDSEAHGRWAVVLDPGGRLRYAGPRVEGEPVLAVLSTQVTDVYLAELRRHGVSYAFAGKDGRDLDAALTVLHEVFDVDRLLLEGGGVTNGRFFAAGLVDEMSLLIYPGLDGRAGSPAIIEAEVVPGLPVFPGMKLQSMSTQVLAAGYVWLRYQVVVPAHATESISHGDQPASLAEP